MRQEKKSYTIHKSKESQIDRELTARAGLRRNLEKTSHRVDSLGEISGVEFICDTKALDLLATRDTFKYLSKPIVWLSATAVHERDYSLLEKYLEKKVKAVVAYGENCADMQSKISSFVEHFATAMTLEEAVAEANKFASKGDVIVYSPSCVAKDDYVNFLDRGNAFKKIFEDLEK